MHRVVVVCAGARIRVELENNGNPPADYEVEDTYWSVTVRQRP